MRTPRSRISGAYFGCAFFFTLLSGFKVYMTSFSQRLRSPKKTGPIHRGAYIVLMGCAEVDRKVFADRFFRYAEACSASPTFEQWWSGMALAFDVAVRQGTLNKAPREGVYRVST